MLRVEAVKWLFVAVDFSCIVRAVLQGMLGSQVWDGAKSQPIGRPSDRPRPIGARANEESTSGGSASNCAAWDSWQQHQY